MEKLNSTPPPPPPTTHIVIGFFEDWHAKSVVESESTLAKILSHFAQKLSIGLTGVMLGGFLSANMGKDFGVIPIFNETIS